jgi:hypothetical protein
VTFRSSWQRKPPESLIDGSSSTPASQLNNLRRQHPEQIGCMGPKLDPISRECPYKLPITAAALVSALRVRLA